MREIFPVEVRPKAIAIVFVIARVFSSFGGWFCGHLIGNGTDHFRCFVGHLVGAGLMLIGAAAEGAFGISAEQRSLEELTRPIRAVADEAPQRSGRGCNRHRDRSHPELHPERPVRTSMQVRCKTFRPPSRLAGLGRDQVPWGELGVAGFAVTGGTDRGPNGKVPSPGKWPTMGCLVSCMGSQGVISHLRSAVRAEISD